METSQIPLEYYVADVSLSGIVLVHIEWLCDKSLPVFEKYIKQKATNIKNLIIGDISDEEIELVGLEVDFITIPEKVICNEIQENINVSSFKISKYPITVGQYRKFANETNYKTTNEKSGDYRTYFSNDLLIGMERNEKESTAATCLSFHDALEYCKWAGVRLPNDHEWLAGRVIDWKNEYKENDITEEMVQKCFSMPNILKRISSEWINEYNPQKDTSVVREGPGYFLEKGWKTKKLRKIYPADYTDLLLQFRVCK